MAVALFLRDGGLKTPCKWPSLPGIYNFLRKLDKDRQDKGCEYAILVSTLEADNELYNTGIVDMSHRYPKMYVVRPQFFVAVICLLRDASRGCLAYRHELTILKQQDLDVEIFMTRLRTCS